MEMSAVRGLIKRARRRIRIQAALEGATTSSILASAAALVAVYAVRSELVAPRTGIAALVGAGLLIIAGAIIAATRALDDEQIARRIDRASNLADRLSTAIAFQRTLAVSTAAHVADRDNVDPHNDLTHGMMVAAIRDGILAAPRANIRAAAPLSWPRDVRVAAAFFAVSAVTAGLSLPVKHPYLAVVAPQRGGATGSDSSKDSAVLFDADEMAYIQTIVADLKSAAQRDQVPELDEFAATVEKLLAKANRGEITKEALLEQLAKAEQALDANSESKPDEIKQQLMVMGKALAGESSTAELGEALQKQDLTKAQDQLRKLADKVAGDKMSPRDKQRLSEQLAKAAQQMAKQAEDQQAKHDERAKKLADAIRRLENDKRQAKDDQQRRDIERRLDDKQRELQKLQKDEQDKQQSEQRRAVKRLQKDLEQAADNLHKRDPQASENLKEAARETGRVDRDQRKQATQQKLASQMDDLREAMRRAKQKNNKGPTDPFNKQGKDQDFIARARGHKSSGQAWRPNQAQANSGGGSGSGQNGGSASWGIGHDDNLTGDPTATSGNTKDEDIQGTAGANGASTRETILAAAQKGFAGVGYKKVYANYQRIVEEVMRTEKLPSSYKYYVKRYFAKIHPNVAGPSSDTESAQP